MNKFLVIDLYRQAYTIIGGNKFLASERLAVFKFKCLDNNLIIVTYAANIEKAAKVAAWSKQIKKRSNN